MIDFVIVVATPNLARESSGLTHDDESPIQSRAQLYYSLTLKNPCREANVLSFLLSDMTISVSGADVT